MKQELLEEKIYALADSEVAKNLQLSVKHDCMGWRLYRGEKVIAKVEHRMSMNVCLF